MPSPFSGMDPYIEDPEIWSDFHHDLPVEIRTQLNAVIRPRYIARLVPYVTYEVVEIAQKRGVRPDVGVWRSLPPRGGVVEAVAVIPSAPVESTVSVEYPLRLATVEVRVTETMELVTAIEILSPVNKRPGHEAHRDYLRKRRELLRSSTHLLEIDLLRAGERPPLETPVPSAPYYITLSRADRRPTVEVWPIQFWNALPTVPVPLLEPDSDAPLDMAAALNVIYERGGYADLIDYHRSPPPPKLTQEELIWLDEWLHDHEMR